MKPKIGELWMVNDTVRVTVGNKVATFRLSGPGLVVKIHENHDEYGDYYTVFWGGKTSELFRDNFVEIISEAR